LGSAERERKVTSLLEGRAKVTQVDGRERRVMPFPPVGHLRAEAASVGSAVDGGPVVDGEDEIEPDAGDAQ
jgi:hypothetical protein